MKQTTKYINKIRSYIVSKYGGVSPQWELSLNMLESNIATFVECDKILAREGYIVSGARGLMVHPAAMLRDKALIRIEKLLTEYGLTPKAEKKLEVSEDDAQDLITALLND